MRSQARLSEGDGAAAGVAPGAASARDARDVARGGPHHGARFLEEESGGFLPNPPHAEHGMSGGLPAPLHREASRFPRGLSPLASLGAYPPPSYGVCPALGYVLQYLFR